MRWVIDASVAIKWIIEEPGRDAARNLLLGGHELLAPEFLLIETANVLRLKIVKGLLPRSQSTSAFATVRDGITRFLPDKDLAADALDLAMRIDHPVYDCMYLACAEHTDADFLTDDRKLIDKLHRIGGWQRATLLTP